MSRLDNINRFVVLMLENRSFDHIFGYLDNGNSAIAGLSGKEFNQEDPNDPSSNQVAVFAAPPFVMTFDPPHEHYDVQLQMYGPVPGTDPDLPIANSPNDPAPMSGFVSNARHVVEFEGDEKLVMGCFTPKQLPVLTTLAKEFAVFNFWYSSLPGPTWPNRFFIHAATSGGLSDSPSTPQIIEGFEFQNGTIYEALQNAGRDWRIYHDGLPQVAGITKLRKEFVTPFTKKFKDIGKFFEDTRSGLLPEYTFIEPRYDTGNNYLNGNSMHPLNDIRNGEALVKQVYEALRSSPQWQDTMLIITFDEHGGFYDHVSPPSTVGTGDDSTYGSFAYTFKFDRLGIRVPAIVISAYTAKQTVIGADPANASTVFDHTSVLVTVEKRFGLRPLTQRDAQANQLECALNLDSPRITSDAAITQLPVPIADDVSAGAVPSIDTFAASPKAALSSNQKALTDLAFACDLQMSPKNEHAALLSNHQKVIEQGDAAAYIQQVEEKVKARRNPQQ